jgi:transcriptional regulator with XRE-family HTH domain
MDIEPKVLLPIGVASGYMCPMSNAEGTYTDPQWTLGDRMSKARRSARLTREDMGDYLGVSSQAVCNWELDKRPPKLQTLRLWALRCGVRLDWLRSGDQVMPPPPPSPEDDVLLRGRGSNPQPSARWTSAVVPLRLSRTA